jgi:predicted nucleic acid-binding Zn ribbon protein
VVDWAQLQLAGEVGSIFVGVLIIFLFLIFRLRRRRRTLADEPLMTRAAREDRAFNQIHLARAAADRLERTGVDVRPVRRMIEQAEAAHARRDNETALAVARSAQEALVRLRDQPVAEIPLSAGIVAPSFDPSDPRTPEAVPMISPHVDASGPFASAVPGLASSGEAPTIARLPKNKAEAHFQLTLLAEELESQGRKGGTSPDLSEAKKLRAAAQSAYDRVDYTEALRLGLKGRRRVGAHLETLPPSAATHPEADAELGPAKGSADEAPAHCSNCGQPLRPTDRFCRGCGSSRGARRCTACGQALAPDDRFCGACGEPIRT